CAFGEHGSHPGEVFYLQAVAEAAAVAAQRVAVERGPRRAGLRVDDGYQALDLVIPRKARGDEASQRHKRVAAGGPYFSRCGGDDQIRETVNAFEKVPDVLLGL